MYQKCINVKNIKEDRDREREKKNAKNLLELFRESRKHSEIY